MFEIRLAGAPCFATGCHASDFKIATAAVRPRNDTKMVGFAIKPTIFVSELFEIRHEATRRRASMGTASVERPCGAPRRARPPRSEPAARLDGHGLRGASLRRASTGTASAERPGGAPRWARPSRSDPAARLDGHGLRGATLRRASMGTASAERPCGAPRRVLESVKKLEALFMAPTARQILHETAQRACARSACAQHTGFLIQYLNQESGSERRAAPVRVSRARSAGAYRAAFLTGSIFRAGYSGRRGCREFRRSRRRICRAARPARCARRPRSPHRARSRRSRPDRRR